MNPLLFVVSIFALVIGGCCEMRPVKRPYVISEKPDAKPVPPPVENTRAVSQLNYLKL
ncbi:hypothetical protein SCG7086_AM_00040 [Chlamydiales bacterium SCGC AG-110-P3]|nr:hypothetical protein SCG7086_AM_00040 [Chlamydiales bacterium SCGC AG-110-P3]